MTGRNRSSPLAVVTTVLNRSIALGPKYSKNKRAFGNLTVPHY